MVLLQPVFGPVHTLGPVRAQTLASGLPAKSLLLPSLYRPVFTLGKLLALEFPSRVTGMRQEAQLPQRPTLERKSQDPGADCARARAFARHSDDGPKIPAAAPGAFKCRI